MTAAMPSRWRQMAARLAQHAAWVLPGASPWAEAMRRELDYIEDDAAALRWAVGGLVASYRARLTHWRCVRVGASLRYAGAGAALMLVIGLAVMRQASGQPLRPVFNQAGCDLLQVSPEVRPRLRCGTVSVPQNYDDPGASRFKLAVVIIKSALQPALPDPIVYISGGPGSPLTVFAGQWAGTQYARNRDLILVDQRGTGRSEPKLCPDLDGRLFDAAIAVAAAPSDAALARRRAIYAACRSEALAQGVDLKDFGTSVTVADFEWVQRALGIARWNVYGESYGTTVAMTLLALHPDTVRAVVLDSLYPPDPRPMQSTNVADALTAFFQYCSGQQACAAAYPDLATTYRETLSGLARAPLIVPVSPEMHRPDNQVSLTSTLFEVLVGNLIYYPTNYSRLPWLIAAVHDRDSQGLGSVLASAYAAVEAEVNRATHVAVECRDRPHYRDPLPAGASVLDRAQLYGLCNDWSDIGPAPLLPLSAVPTLVLAGEFDPVTRPSQSRHVAALIGPKARWVEFPRVGHNVRAFSPCGAELAAEFIDNPAQPLDTSCAGRAAPIRFLPKQQNGRRRGPDG